MLFRAFCRHLADFRFHCNVGATADTLGCWQVGATTSKQGTGRIRLRVPGVLHGRYQKASKRLTIGGNKKVAKVRQTRIKIVKTSIWTQADFRSARIIYGFCFWAAPCWYFVDFGSHFGAHRISKGRSAWCFSTYLAQPQKLDNLVLKLENAKQRRT